MYRKHLYSISRVKGVETYEGESIERKVERIVHNNEPITDGSPEIFTPLKEGVIPAYNVRTDRFEIAADAMDKVARSMDGQRDNKPSIGKKEKEDSDGVADGKSTDGSDTDSSTKSE